MFKTKLIYHYWLNGKIHTSSKPTICNNTPSLTNLIVEAKNFLTVQKIINPNIDMISITMYEIRGYIDNTESEILVPLITLVYRSDDKAMVFSNIVAEDLKCFFSK